MKGRGVLMTPDEIRALLAGPDLDARVAEARGWRKGKTGQKPPGDAGVPTYVLNRYGRVIVWRDGQACRWEPSIDVNHALEAAGKILSGPDLTFHRASGPGTWAILQDGEPLVIVDGREDWIGSLSLAICQAVLIASAGAK